MASEILRQDRENYKETNFLSTEKKRKFRRDEFRGLIAKPHRSYIRYLRRDAYHKAT